MGLLLASGVALILFGLIGSGLLIALALYASALFAMGFFTPVPTGSIMAVTVWGSTANWSLTALPLFIWMGEILFHTRLSENMFRGLSPWMMALPGRLAHVNIVGCGIFAAASGSSSATAATIGRITVPELRRRGYGDALTIGSLCGAGTLGLLIPPSIMLIVYGIAAQVSIVRLFMAGIVPGIILIFGMMAAVALWSVVSPNAVPPREKTGDLLWKIRETRHLFPLVVLILLVIGSIYTGFATASEAAVIGVIGSLLLSAFSGTLTWEAFTSSALSAVRTTCMIGFILAAAAFLSSAMTLTGLPKTLAATITAYGFGPYMLILVLTLLYIAMGCILDGVSMVVLTTSIVLPLVEAAGFNLVWFGVYIIIVIEIAQITPPVGLNLYVLQGLTGRNIGFISKATLPFLFVMILIVALITVVPEIVTFLPERVFGNG
ncbi:TRAP transporter large permease [Sneathiella litorea]|uniref:TRAP transporter large permease protein n=1 Tax=Sneathiella litorea TaxID=2606216 RepID=A0A6L8W9W2_9PROT|nr:TRAP transporter large permease subunit [Sneathiella litorea]MZR31499.1 TRAP transporter large permease subunit [Sneathiella litorea]